MLASDPSALAGLSVLIVDDHQNTRSLLKAVMRGLGVRSFVEAGDAVEALETIQAQTISLGLFDCMMPGVDGLELTRMLRSGRDSPNQELPIIMCTGYSSQAILREAVDAGVDELIVKPFSSKAILERLVSVTQHRRPFVDHDSYAGPCRRRLRDRDYMGPMRRSLEAEGLI